MALIMPLVSVIMLSYNHEKYLAQSIESVLTQTFTNFELIIVDDCSIDNSRQIIAQYCEQDNRIKTLLHSANKGIAQTVNDGIEAAIGQFIAITASDDIWLPNKLAEQIKILESDADLIVWSEAIVIDSEGNATGELFTGYHKALEKPKSGYILSDLLIGNYISSQSFIFNRDNIANIRFDSKLKYLNDHKFMVELANKYKFYFIETPLVKYRVHGTNSIFSSRSQWLTDLIKLNHEFIEKYFDKIDRNIKCEILTNLGGAYCANGNYIKARYYALRLMLLNPLIVRSWICIITGFNYESAISKILWNIYYRLNFFIKKKA